MIDLLASTGNFALYFGSAVALLFLFKIIYAFVTPHNEWQLIKEQQNTAAAIAFGGAVVGFAIAVGGAASNSVADIDFIVWALVALVAQLLAFVILKLTFMPKISERIEKNETSAGVMLGLVSVAVGILNAACMSY
jgi:putative membrane protein